MEKGWVTCLIFELLDYSFMDIGVRHYWNIYKMKSNFIFREKKRWIWIVFQAISIHDDNEVLEHIVVSIKNWFWSVWFLWNGTIEYFLYLVWHCLFELVNVRAGINLTQGVKVTHMFFKWQVFSKYFLSGTKLLFVHKIIYHHINSLHIIVDAIENNP